MKALVLTGVRQVAMQEMPIPTPKEGEALIRVRATGICGSDLHGFLGHSPRRQPGLVLGHEVVGTVESDGPMRGRRVAVNPLITCGSCRSCRAGRQNCCPTWRLLGMDQTHGGFAEYVVAPEKNLNPLPGHVSDAAAVMIEPLANALHLVSHVPSTAGSFPTAILVGGGTLGACILVVAKAKGIRVEWVIEPNPLRAKAAEALGAGRTADPRGFVPAEKLDIAFEAVGNQSARRLAVDSVANGGTVLLLGLTENENALRFQEIVRKEIRLQGSFAYTDTDFAEAVTFVSEGRADFSPWTDLAPLDRGQQCFERLASDPGDRLKIGLSL